MKHTCTIKNMGALPIPYVVKNGEHIKVDSLFKDKPVLCDSNLITGTAGNQIEVGCTNYRLTFPAHPDLVILFHDELKK